jgi:hypothetical protein
MNTQLKKVDTETGKIESIENDAWNCRATNVIVENGKVFVNTAVCKVLGFRTVYERPSITWGRERFYNLTKIFDEAVEHATFARRNSREQAVADRNLKLIEILMGLVA